jgi:hypothetical protein
MALDLASTGATRPAVESMARNLSAAIDRTRRVKRSLAWRAGSSLGGSSQLHSKEFDRAEAVFTPLFSESRTL